MDERIPCKKCTKRITPRLWHYGGGIFTYMKLQHLCPYCGTVQYETGGGIRTWFKVVAAVLVAPIILQLLFLLV